MPDPLHRKNAAEWVMYMVLFPFTLIVRLTRKVSKRGG